MKKNADIFVRHILDSVEQIEKYTNRLSYEIMRNWDYDLKGVDEL